MAPKISLKLPKLRRKKMYLAQLPRRGGSVQLATIESKDLDDARRTLMEHLPELITNPRIASILRNTKYIHLIDMETGDKIKIPNPLYNPTEDEQNKNKTKKDKDIDIEDLQKMLNLELVETLGKTMVSVIGTAMSSAMNMIAKTMGEVMSEIMKAQAESIKNSIKNMIPSPQQQQQNSNLEAVKIFLEFIKMWPYIKQYGPEIARYFKQQLQSNEQINVNMAQSMEGKHNEREAGEGEERNE